MFRDQLAELPKVLPPVGLLDDASADIVERTRAVLSLLDFEASSGCSAIASNPFECPNCNRPCPSTRSPYCSDRCRETSAFVRQFRNSVETGVILGVERQEALGQKLWFVLGGGYPRREALVPPKVILKVLERQGGLCEECGAKATTIDHSGSG